MGFNKPIENKLTVGQKSVLAKLTAIRNFQLDSNNSKLRSLLDSNPPPEEQVSVFDYLKKIIESILGTAALDLYLKTFLDKMFDPNNDKLERMVIKSMAKSLDENGVNLASSNGALSAVQAGFSDLATLQANSAGSNATTVSSVANSAFATNINNSTVAGSSLNSVSNSINNLNSAGNTEGVTAFGSSALASNINNATSLTGQTSGQTNEEWLIQHVLPLLNAAFRIVKAEIVKQIIAMTFGPKEKMSNDPVQQSYLLNAAICSSDMFSMSNPTSESDGDFEFNKVELKKRLEKGEMVFTISCQDVKIKLPESILNQADYVIANNLNPNKPKINPAIMFEQLNNVVTAETQRINSPENANSIRKSFIQIMVEKVLNLLTVAIEPYTKVIFGAAATSTGNPNITSATFIPSPCDVRTMCDGGENEEFKKKTAFAKTMMNAMLAYLLAVMLQRLIKEIKKIIKNFILKKSQEAIKRKMAKKTFVSDEQLQKLEKAKKFAEAMTQLNDIFKFNAS
jgi:hypothetical protein